MSGNLITWIGFGILGGGIIYDWFSYRTLRVTTTGGKIVFWGGALIVLAGTVIQHRNNKLQFETNTEFGNIYAEQTPDVAVIDEMAGLGLSPS